MTSGDIMRSPGVLQFIGAAARTLAERRTLLAPLPAVVDPASVWRALQRELWGSDLRLEQVSLPTLPDDVSPSYALADFLQAPRRAGGATALARADGLPAVLSLSGFDRLGDAPRAAWSDFITQWARQSQSIHQEGREPTALCLLSPAPALLPHLPATTDLYLVVYWWWGVPTLLDFRLQCRLRSTGDDEGRWREGILPELASADDGLVNQLWAVCDQDFETILEVLKGYAMSCGWSPNALRRWGWESFHLTNRQEQAFTVEPPTRLRELWSAGVLYWTAEYGPELHSAALAALDLRAHLQHRMWRGQMALLLPLLDQVRLALCEALTLRYACDWPVKWIQPENERDVRRVTSNPLACDLGHVLYLMRNVPELSEVRTLMPTVQEACRLRNEMAHYRLVSFSDLGYLRQELAQISRK